MFVLSLLNQRILSLIKGANVGDALGDSTVGRTIISLANEVVENGGSVRQTFERNDVLNTIGINDGPIVLHAPGLAMTVGIIKKPQDHNGIVDDVITSMARTEPTDVVTAGACALAATIAALLDGWGIEGAMDLANFVGKRGRSFGTKTSVDVVAEIERVLEAVEDASISGLMNIRSTLDLDNELWGMIPFAFGLAYAYRDANQVVDVVMRLKGIRPTVLRSLVSITGAICAADRLKPYVPRIKSTLDERQLVRLVDNLAEIRTRDVQVHSSRR